MNAKWNCRHVIQSFYRETLQLQMRKKCQVENEQGRSEAHIYNIIWMKLNMYIHIHACGYSVEQDQGNTFCSTKEDGKKAAKGSTWDIKIQRINTCSPCERYLLVTHTKSVYVWRKTLHHSTYTSLYEKLLQVVCC